MSEEQLTIPSTPNQVSVREERAPVEIGDRGVVLNNMDEMGRFCIAVVKSRLAPKGFETPEAVMVAVQHGLEIGLGPMQALQSIAVINGRPCLWGDAALALVMAHPDFMDIREWTEEETAHCEVKRRNRTPVLRTFSDADAKTAGLLGKSGPWTLYKPRMRQMRARAFALRDSFPDVLRGVTVREEIQDVERPVTGRVLERPKAVMPDEAEA